jgi:uncharacterized protein YjbI with pentapeptide repeats
MFLKIRLVMPQEIAVKLSELKEYQKKHLRLLLKHLPEGPREFTVDYLARDKHTKEKTQEFHDNIKQAQKNLTANIAEAEKKEQKTAEEQALLNNSAAKDLSHFCKTILRTEDDVIPVLDHLTIDFGLDGADLSGSLITNTYFKEPVNSTLNLSDCEISRTKFETKEYKNVGSYLKPSYELDIDFPNMHDTYVDANCMAVSTGYTRSSTNVLTKVMERQGLPVFYPAGPGPEEEQPSKPSLAEASVANEPTLSEKVKEPAATLTPEVTLAQAVPSIDSKTKTLRVDSNPKDLENYAAKHREFLKKHGGLTEDELENIHNLEKKSRLTINGINYLKKCYSKAYQVVRDQEASFSEEVRNSPEFSSRGSYAEYLSIESKTGPVQPIFEDFVGFDSIDVNLTAADLTGTTFKNCTIDGQINATTILAGAHIEDTVLPTTAKLDFETQAPKSRKPIVKAQNNLVDVETLVKYAESHREFEALSLIEKQALAKDSELYKARAGLNEYIGIASNETVTLINKDGSKPIVKDCDLRGANLSGVNFNGASFEKVILKDTKLEGAALSRAYFKDCSFENTSLKQSILSSATFEHCVLDKNTNLDQALVEGMRIEDSDVNASLASVVAPADRSPFRVIGSNVNLSTKINAKLENTAVYPSKALVEQYITYAAAAGKEAQSFSDFLGVSAGSDIVVKGYDFKGKDFTNANFSGVTFEKVVFKDADLSYANFTNCHMNNCNLKRANFNNANLTQSKLTNCKLVNATFENAEMYDSKVKGYQEDKDTKLTDESDIFKGAKNFSNLNLYGNFSDKFKDNYTPLNYYQSYVEKPVMIAQVAAATAMNVATDPKVLLVAGTVAVGVGAAALAVGVGVTVAVGTAAIAAVTTGGVTAATSSKTQATMQQGINVAMGVYKARTQNEHEEATNKAAENVKENTKKVSNRFSTLKSYLPSVDKVMVALAIAVTAAAIVSTAGLALPICLAAGVVAGAVSYVGYSAARQKIIEAKDFVVDKVKKLFSKEKAEPEVAKSVAKSTDKQTTVEVKKDTPEVAKPITPVVAPVVTQPEAEKVAKKQPTTVTKPTGFVTEASARPPVPAATPSVEKSPTLDKGTGRSLSKN